INLHICTMLSPLLTLSILYPYTTLFRSKPERTSYQIAKAMQQSGYKIIPINPNVDEVLNEKSYQSLKEVEEEIDIVNVFRRSEHLPAIANEAKDLNIKGF